MIGGEYVGEGPVQCAGGRGCGAESRAPDPLMMMMMMDTSSLPVIGIGRNKRNMRQLRRARRVRKQPRH